MAKAQKESATLVSSEGTCYFYINRKNRRKLKGEKKLKLRKYDPVLRKHVIFEEKKLSRAKKVKQTAASSGDNSGANSGGAAASASE